MGKYEGLGVNPAIRPLSARQYRTLLAEHELTQADSARLLGVNDGSARRWASNGVMGAAALVLRLLSTGKLTIQDLEEVPRD